MKKDLLEILMCPDCQGSLELASTLTEGEEIKEGSLTCGCGRSYQVKGFIPRFVEDDKYVTSFSFEWKKHQRTQLDSTNQNGKMSGESRRSFEQRVDFPLSQLKDKIILDVGCGMGRYAEIALEAGGKVVGVDLSLAVEMAFKNIGHHKNMNLIQADIFHLPLKKERFDFVYSFGVLHHTPDCEKAFSQLPKLLKRGGKLSISLYSSYNKGIVYMSHFWRFFSTKMPKKLLYYLTYLTLPLYYLYKVPYLGSIGKMMLPLPTWPDWRWRILDTFDWYSPKYQSKHTHWEVFRWFKGHGLEDIFIGENEITLQGVKK